MKDTQPNPFQFLLETKVLRPSSNTLWEEELTLSLSGAQLCEYTPEMPQILYPPQEDNNDKDDQARAQRELLPSALILCPMWMCPQAHPWVLKLKCFNLSGKKKKKSSAYNKGKVRYHAN